MFKLNRTELKLLFCLLSTFLLLFGAAASSANDKVTAGK